jgi:flagellar biosynthesis regulator FlaF
MIEKIYGKINLDIQPKKQESLTVLGKRKYEDEPRKRITVKDIFTKNVTPDANKILWGIAYQPLLDKYKSKLIEKINDPNSNKTTKLVYDYVLQNLERGLFAVEEIKKLSNESKSQIDILKFDKMSKIWQSLLNDAKIIYNKLEKEKVSKIQEIEKEKEALKLKRETISAAKKLKSIELSDDEDDLTELKSDKKYPPYLERIAKKRGF